MEDLITLRGVARKTANIVLGNSFGIVEGIAVDTHVNRLAHRLGFSEQKNPDKIEQDLMRLVPQDRWFDFTYVLIDHGRALHREEPSLPRVPGRAAVPGQPGVNARGRPADGGGAPGRVGRAAREHDRGVRGCDRRRRRRGRVRRPDDGRRDAVVMHDADVSGPRTAPASCPR